jgi:lipoprotein-anchoring transpeptidase ErfK/SrfK
MNKSIKNYRRYTLSLASVLFACLLFFSACGTNISGQTSTTNAGSPTAIPSPTITPELQKQGGAELQSFQQWITLMQQYSGNVDTYQQQYTADQQALNSATSNATYQAVLKRLQGHVIAIKLPAMKTEATSLQQQLQQGSTQWSQQHTYYDAYNQTTYNLGYEYGLSGISSWAQQQIDNSQTLADYQQTIENLQMWLYNFSAYKADFVDKTPYNQVHQTDTQLLQHVGYTSGKVIVISLAEEAMRVYQDGHLVNSFLVVTGMPQHPSLPGIWWVESRQTDITFTSGKQPGQEGYYPPTPIAYALQYHSGGYFIHQSWWRTEYGPNKQFPHIDVNGTPFAYEGSHGCVNMSTSDVQWLYNFASTLTTKIVIY